MNHITDITSEGLTYIDDEGNSQSIDFEICLQNYIGIMEKALGADFTDQDRAFY